MLLCLLNMYNLPKSFPCDISLQYVCMPWPVHMDNWYDPTGSKTSALQTPAVPYPLMCCNITSGSLHTSWMVTHPGVWSRSPSDRSLLCSYFFPLSPHRHSAHVISVFPGDHHGTSKSTSRTLCLLSVIWGTCGLQYCPSCIPHQSKGVQSYGSALDWTRKFHLWNRPSRELHPS